MCSYYLYPFTEDFLCELLNNCDSIPLKCRMYHAVAQRKRPKNAVKNCNFCCACCNTSVVYVFSASSPKDRWAIYVSTRNSIWIAESPVLSPTTRVMSPPRKGKCSSTVQPYVKYSSANAKRNLCHSVRSSSCPRTIVCGFTFG